MLIIQMVKLLLKCLLLSTKLIGQHIDKMLKHTEVENTFTKNDLESCLLWKWLLLCVLSKTSYKNKDVLPSQINCAIHFENELIYAPCSVKLSMNYHDGAQCVAIEHHGYQLSQSCKTAKNCPSSEAKKELDKVLKFAHESSP